MVNMSWGTELWDQFDNVAGHTQRGIDFLEKCGQVMRERCTIEFEYATKLRRLVKNNNPKKKDEEEQFSCCKAFTGMMNEINDLAGQHEIIAENLNSAVTGDLGTFTKEIKEERKRHLQEGAKVQTNLQACFMALDKARKNYEKAYREAEKTQENFVKADADLNLSRVEVEKARNLKTLKVQQCEDNKNEYANHLQKYNDLQYQHYNSLMPAIFTQLQEMDERRILEFKKLISLSAEIERKVFPIINQCIDGITKAANSIDEKEDSRLVIDKYKSGFQSPADIPFEDLSTMKLGSTGSGSSNESNGPIHHSTVRSESSMLLGGTLSGGKIKRRHGIFGFFAANKPNVPETKDDYSDLPPNQRKKKLQHKLDNINSQIQQETATRDGLMKMKVVYEQNNALGDPQSIEGQLVKTGYKLDNLRQELHKYQTYMADATNSMTPNTQKKNRNSISDDSLSRSASDSSMTNPINNNSRSSLKGSTLPAHTSTIRVEAPTAEPEYLNDDDEEEANGGEFEEVDSLPILGTCKALYGFDGTAQSEGSIPMRDGEIFQVVELDQGDGWTRVRRDTQEEGFVPTSYIECYLYTDV